MSPEGRDPTGVTVTVSWDRHAPRTWRLSRARLRLALGGLTAFVLAAALMAGATWHTAIRAARLQEEVGTLREERSRVVALAERLSEIETRYEGIRHLFGPEAAVSGSELWLPPAGGGSRPRRARSDREANLPTSWPLTERGFITQPQLEEGGADHPGVDIAVPTDSYIRASGSGTVADVGDDPVYGRFLVLQHGEGYRTLYAHASLVLVELGASVRQNEVIATSGSTGRSTAPHLHFEILRDGEPVDPLSMVRQP